MRDFQFMWVTTVDNMAVKHIILLFLYASGSTIARIIPDEAVQEDFPKARSLSYLPPSADNIPVDKARFIIPIYTNTQSTTTTTTAAPPHSAKTGLEAVVPSNPPPYSPYLSPLQYMYQLFQLMQANQYGSQYAGVRARNNAQTSDFGSFSQFINSIVFPMNYLAYLTAAQLRQSVQTNNQLVQYLTNKFNLTQTSRFNPFTPFIGQTHSQRHLTPLPYSSGAVSPGFFPPQIYSQNIQQDTFNPISYSSESLPPRTLSPNSYSPNAFLYPGISSDPFTPTIPSTQIPVPSPFSLSQFPSQPLYGPFSLDGYTDQAISANLGSLNAFNSQSFSPVSSSKQPSPLLTYLHSYLTSPHSPLRSSEIRGTTAEDLQHHHSSSPHTFHHSSTHSHSTDDPLQQLRLQLKPSTQIQGQHQVQRPRPRPQSRPQSQQQSQRQPEHQSQNQSPNFTQLEAEVISQSEPLNPTPVEYVSRELPEHQNTD